MNLKKINRKTHYWISAILIIPLLLVTISGIFLLLKKEVSWIQPPTIKGQGKIPTISMDEILTIARTVGSAEIKSWKEIDKLDVRPSQGVIKIISKNNWEIQIDHQNGKILSSKYRRSDIIEGLHDGSFFHKKLKLWIFLPTGIMLFILIITGIYMFIVSYNAKNKKSVNRN